MPDNDFKIILKSLWEYRACSYWHYSEKGMRYLDEMLNKGWLVKSDNLLTKEEKRYFSYYMDNEEFTNGFAYRNLYAHVALFLKKILRNTISHIWYSYDF